MKTITNNNKHLRVLLIIAALGLTVLAEEMKFSYNLQASQNICFQ